MNRIEAVWQVADALERFGLIALTIATFAQTLFVILYARRPWHVERIGRALMLKSASLCLLLWLSLLNTFVVYTHQRLVAVATLAIITAAIVYQLLALVLSPRQPEEGP